MFFASFTASQGFSKLIALKLLIDGIALFLVGLFILLFPMVIAMLVSIFCFTGGAFLLAAAWKIFQATRSISSPPGRPVEDAVWRELR